MSSGINKTRIIKRTARNGSVDYVIQHKHWLFRWRWADAYFYGHPEYSPQACYDTLDEAKSNLCYFDGTKVRREVIYG